MNLEALNNIFHNLFDDEFSIFIYAGKFIGVLIFIFTIGKKAFQSFSTYGIALKKDQEGLSPYDIVRGLIILAVIVSITEILSLADNILLLIERIGTSKFTPDLTPFALYDVQLEDPDTGNSTLDQLVLGIRQINQNLNPTMWILKGFYLMLYLVDVVLFTVFIAQRFFFMGVIKLFAPIILGLSILPQYKDLSYNLGKTYIRNFLVIIPYMLVFVFANRVHDGMIAFGHEIGGGAGSIAMMGMGELAQRNVALLAVVAIKFMLLRKSSEFMKQLI